MIKRAYDAGKQQALLDLGLLTPEEVAEAAPDASSYAPRYTPGYPPAMSGYPPPGVLGLYPFAPGQTLPGDDGGAWDAFSKISPVLGGVSGGLIGALLTHGKGLSAAQRIIPGALTGFSVGWVPQGIDSALDA